MTQLYFVGFVVFGWAGRVFCVIREKLCTQSHAMPGVERLESSGDGKPGDDMGAVVWREAAWVCLFLYIVVQPRCIHTSTRTRNRQSVYSLIDQLQLHKILIRRKRKSIARYLQTSSTPGCLLHKKSS